MIGAQVHHRRNEAFNICNCRLIFYGILYLVLLCGCGEKNLIKVGNKPINKEHLKYKIAIDMSYGEEKPDTTSVFLVLIQQMLKEIIAEKEGILITEQMIKDEAERIDQETKAPEIIEKVKKIFGKDRKGYLEHYVKPVFVERYLEQKFFYDTLYQKIPYDKIKEGFSRVKKNLPIVDTEIRIFKPQKELLDFYKNGLGKGICEDKHSYYFVRGKEKNIEVYLVTKNNYTEWFQKKALDFPVVIYDNKLREMLIVKVKGNKFWEELLR
jgi:hypothetical protein